MRALLVCAAPVVGYEDLISVLAADSDLVIAVDGGATLCEAAHVVPDVVVGDFDSFDDVEGRRLEWRQTDFVTYSPDKDSSDLDLALEESRARGASEVVVCAASSGRLDHTLAAVGSVSRAADLAPVIAESAQMAWLLSEEHRPTLEIGPTGSTWSLIATTCDAIVSVAGVKWPLDHAHLAQLSSLGLSNVVVETTGTVLVHRGRVLVIGPVPDD